MPKARPVMNPMETPLQPGLYVAAQEFVAVSPEPVTRHGESVGSLPLPLRIGFEGRYMNDQGHVSPFQLIELGKGDLSYGNTAGAIRMRDDIRRLASRFVGAAEGSIEALHLEELTGAGPQLGYFGGWSLQPDLIRRNVKPIDQRIIDWLVGHLERSPPYTGTLSVPTKTSHSDPTFGSGPDDLLCHLAIAQQCSDGSSARRVFKELHRDMGFFKSLDTPLFVISSRSGPNAKLRDVFAFVEGRLCLVARSKGYDTRRRSVRMASTAYNEAIRTYTQPRWESFKKGQLGRLVSHGSRRSVNEKIRAAIDMARTHWGHTLTIRSDDASNFDDTIPRVHLEQIWNAMYANTPAPGLLHMLNDSFSLSGPLIAGTGGWLHPIQDGMPSGLVTTSQDDSFVNLCAIIESWAVASGVAIPRFLELVDGLAISIFVQGDDSLLIGPSFDESKYIAHMETFGFVRKIGKYPVFLKVWHEREFFHTLASRALTRSVYREYVNTSDLVELFGIFLRWTSAKADPYFSAFWQWLVARHATLLKFGLVTLDQVAAYLKANASSLLADLQGPQAYTRFSGLYQDMVASAEEDRSGFVSFVLERARGLSSAYEDRERLSAAAASFDFKKFLRLQWSSWESVFSRLAAEGVD